MDYALASFDSAAASNVVCDTVTKMTNFDGAAYMGVWYEQQSVLDQPFGDNSITCSQSKYSDLLADGHFTVRNSSETSDFSPSLSATGTGYCPDLSGECYVSFWSRAIRTPNYFVLETDYTSFSIVYNCSPDSMQFLWFLTRDKVISDELY